MRKLALHGLALALVALVLAAGATGCSTAGRSDKGGVVPEGTTASTDASGAVEQPASPSIDSTLEDADQTSQDPSAIIRELDAIERELGGVDLPSETDFDALEGEIR